jgi:hypothetical protein
MLTKQIFTAILALALASLACSVNIHVPVVEVKTGAVQTEKISVPSPQSDVVDVTLAFGAGEFKLAPGAQKALIEGTATYNVPEFKPKVKTDGNQVRLEIGNLKINGIPNFEKTVKNEWDLELSDQPMDLHISAGAYQAKVELGGLALKSLEVDDGAASVDLKFSEPNLVEMDSLSYETGASTVNLKGLANANFRNMTFRSGAGDYILDFSGDLQRDANVSVSSGISHVAIVIPEGVSAKVTVKEGLSNVEAQGSWQKSGSEYQLPGSGPSIHFIVDMGMGSLELRNQ